MVGVRGSARGRVGVGVGVYPNLETIFTLDTPLNEISVKRDAFCRIDGSRNYIKNIN